MASREESIQSALDKLNSGFYSSLRAASRAYKIPRSTLRARLAGSQSHTIAHRNQQRLTIDQEESLAKWILDEDSRAHPPSHARVREMASLILQANGDNAPLGKNWMTSFLQRQTNVHTVVGRSIEAVRATAGNQETIRSFFEVFSQTVRRLNIKTENIWNMDETGLALGVCSNSRVLSSSLKHKAYVKSPNTREWVSIIETASASGRRLRPAVIFKGQSLQTSWFPPQSLPDWLYTTSENGWTSNSVGLAWLRQIFIPESTPTQYDYRLLLLDGHGSHADVEFMWTCYQNKIACLYLPAHTSHILQPLDLAPFSVVKSKYRQEIQALASIDDAAPVKKERFITSYNKARIEGLSGRVIRAGWRASGLCPYNPELVLQSTQVQARRAATPPPISPNNLSHEVPMTPKRSQDLYRSQKLLERDVNLGRSTRYLLAKAGKAISRGNTEIAQLRASNARLQAQLDQHRINKPKKRIQINSNERFKDIEAIKLAMDQAEGNSAETVSNRRATNSVRIETDEAASNFSSMCNQWQI